MEQVEKIKFENCEHSTYEIARGINTPLHFARIFDNFLNSGGKQYSSGVEVGKELRTTHRTLQRLAVCFALGIIAGLSEQEYTDARNETAIKTAKKIKEMVDNGELPLGAYL
jgi:hypothetical protein